MKLIFGFIVPNYIFLEHDIFEFFIFKNTTRPTPQYPSKIPKKLQEAPKILTVHQKRLFNPRAAGGKLFAPTLRLSRYLSNAQG